MVVIISAGEKYGHPHKQALENFIIAGAQIYCTSKNGAVTITTDGDNYSLSCNKINWLDNYLGYKLRIRKL